MSPLRCRPESGFATVWALAWMFACLSLGWLSLLAAGAVAAQHHLDGAADLASLAAAGQLQLGFDGCAAARTVSNENTVEVMTCRVEGADVVITVADSIALPFGLDGRLISTARAGPAELTGGHLRDLSLRTP